MKGSVFLSIMKDFINHVQYLSLPFPCNHILALEKPCLYSQCQRTILIKTLNYTLQNKGKWKDKEKSTFSVHLVCSSAFLKNCIIMWLKYLDTKFLETHKER